MNKRLVAVIFLTTVFFLPTSAVAQKEAIKPDGAFLYLMAARNAAKAGKYETAINRYRRLIEKYPQITDARNELGWVLARAGRMEEAKVEYERVLEEKPQDKEALKGLLDILRKLGKKDEALSVLERLVILAPEDRGLRLQLATELHNRRKYSEAEKHFAILLGEKE